MSISCFFVKKLKLGLFKFKTLCYYMSCAVVWLSLVERYIRDVEAAGSNPVTAIKRNSFAEFRFFGMMDIAKETAYRALCVIPQKGGLK